MSPTLIIGNGEAGGLLGWVKALLPILTAFLAAYLALRINASLDARRARREHRATMADNLREDVRTAVELAAEYWSDKPWNKSILEAKMKMLEREIRAGLALVVAGETGDEATACNDAAQDFLMVLTGADFEAAKVKPNPAHLRDVSGHGVALRKAIAARQSSILKKT